MKLSKKALALLVGLTVSVSGTAFAAEGADSFSDVPQGHWAYDALDYLAKDGVIDGMGDGTFQGDRTMTRYEMASIVAKAMQKGGLGIGDQAVLDKLAAEYGDEIATLKKQTAQNTKDIKDLKEKTDKFKIWGMSRIQAGDDNGLKADSHNGDYNNRFYMDLEGQMKVNDHAVARFTIEKNARYRDREYVMTGKGGVKDGRVVVGNVPITGSQRDLTAYDENHSGTISNIWMELQLGPKHDWYTNIGRKWNGIGMQNLLLGGQVDGIQTYHPIEHGHGWWMSAQYWKSAADCTDYRTEETANGSGIYKVTDIYSRRSPIVATLNFWGPIGKYLDANVSYSRLVGNKYQDSRDDWNKANGYWYDTSGFWAADLKAKLFKDFTVTGSYVKAITNTTGGNGHGDRDIAVRIDYRGTDLNKKGSWGLYAKWMNLGAYGDLGHDDEWSTREPTFCNGVRGWYYGFKFVPAKNVEWETLWAPHLKEDITWGTPYNRHILRSWVDFHF